MFQSSPKPSLQSMKAVTFVICVVGASASLCLQDGIPEEQRRNLTTSNGSMALGSWAVDGGPREDW